MKKINPLKVFFYFTLLSSICFLVFTFYILFSDKNLMEYCAIIQIFGAFSFLLYLIGFLILVKKEDPIIISMIKEFKPPKIFFNID